MERSRLGVYDARKLILKVTQSPMNPQRWVLDLECGHEVWITNKLRPLRRHEKCPECALNDAGGNHA